MTDIRTLGVLSGIAQGSLQGLKFIKAENEREEELAEKKRKELERLLREGLPYASEKQAQAMFEIVGIPDDQKKLYAPIVGVARDEPPIDLMSNLQNLQMVADKYDMEPERAYSRWKEVVARMPEMTDYERGQWLDIGASRLGYTVPTKEEYSTSEKIQLRREWNRAKPDGRKALEQLHPGINFFEYEERPDSGRKPPVDAADIRRAQINEVEDLIHDIDNNLDDLKRLSSKAPEELESAGISIEELKRRRDRQIRKREFLKDRRQKLRNRTTPIPADKFEEWVDWSVHDIRKRAEKFGKEVRGKKQRVDFSKYPSATLPETGEKIYFVDGKWRKYKDGKWQTVK